MIEIHDTWSLWTRPSAGMATVQWSVLLALAAVAGQLAQNRLGLPKILGYSVVGAAAGLGGFPGATWPLEGAGLFLLELGVAIVLFEAGGRLALRWLWHNPMVLLQSLLESALTWALAYFTLRALQVEPAVAQAVALVAMVSSPAVLSRIMLDLHAKGPATERALALTTLGTLYVLVLVTAQAPWLGGGDAGSGTRVLQAVVALALSLLVGALVALAMRLALRVMSPTSESTSILLVCLISAGTALAGHFGGPSPLAALVGGMILKQLHPRPWAWPRQLGTAASALVMLTFVLVSVVAAQAPWNPAVSGVVIALLAARALGKTCGVGLATWGSGLGWTQSVWAASAMLPMSSVALLLVLEFWMSAPDLGPAIASIALPAILLMEVLGAMTASLALQRAGETGRETRGG